MRYITNHVLMLAIIYLTNNLVLTELECNKFQAPLSVILKHKLNQASTAPQNILYNNLEYDIYHLWDR